MTDDIAHGLSGVVAFETRIAEPDRDGGRLRYRGIDVEQLIGRVDYGSVWGLLVDGDFTAPLPVAEPFVLPVHAGDTRADIQSSVVLAGARFGLRPMVDITDAQARHDAARVASAAISIAGQSARGADLSPVPHRLVEQGSTAAERFMIAWQGEPDPQHVKAVDTYWITAAEHGLNASTFTARVVASTGTDVAASISAAIGALSGPLHGGAPSRALSMIEAVERSGDARGYVRSVLDSGQRLMGFGHAIYRAEDPRARILRETARRLEAPRYEVATAVEEAALAEFRERRPDRVLETNVEFWAAVVLDFAQIPDTLFTPLFCCARMGGWSAHILEQKRLGKIVRPSARYVGAPETDPANVAGWPSRPA